MNSTIKALCVYYFWKNTCPVRIFHTVRFLDSSEYEELIYEVLCNMFCNKDIWLYKNSPEATEETEFDLHIRKVNSNCSLSKSWIQDLHG